MEIPKTLLEIVGKLKIENYLLEQTIISLQKEIEEIKGKIEVKQNQNDGNIHSN